MAKIQTTKVFKFLEDSNKRITVMQGGTRSSKTYNIMLWLIKEALRRENLLISICRETSPSLKKTVMRDFVEIMINVGQFEDKRFNQSQMIYKFPNGSVIEFLNLEDDQKVRGGKRDILFVNEANEVKLSIWKQLIFRTREKAILDYNPSDEIHWIYDEVVPRDDCDTLITTYLDNPFLPAEQVAEIERLKDIDENYWRIYGLGLKGYSQSKIYTNWDYVEGDIPEGEVFYGLDFGFNNPSALVKITIADNAVYTEEIFYQSGLTIQDIIQRLFELKSNNVLDSNSTIYGDNSRPEAIEEIYRAGFNIHPCKKGPDSVKQGIDLVKRHKLLITKDSVNLIKEIKSYKWKEDKNENILDEPIKFNDHSMDALRYAFNEKMEPKPEFSLGEFEVTF